MSLSTGQWFSNKEIGSTASMNDWKNKGENTHKNPFYFPKM